MSKFPLPPPSGKGAAPAKANPFAALGKGGKKPQHKAAAKPMAKGKMAPPFQKTVMPPAAAMPAAAPATVTTTPDDLP